MKTTYELVLAALYRVKNVCQLNNTALLLIPEAVTERANLDDIILRFEKAKAINLADLSNLAVNKEAIMNTLVDIILKYVNRAVVKARQLGKVDLTASLTVSRSSIINLIDADIATRCEELKEIIKTNIALLTNIQPADITEMEEAIANYQAVLAAPKVAIELRKSDGTDRIPQIAAESEVIKAAIVRIFHSYLPDQAHIIDVAAHVGKPIGARTTSIIIKYTDAETAAILKKVTATMSNELASKVRKSSSRGTSRFYSLLSGNYTLTSEFQGYITDIRKNISINDKKVVRIDIKLQQITPQSALDITVLEKLTSNPLANVQISIPSLNFIGTTNNLGRLLKTGIPPATYQGTLFLETYKKLDFTFTIKSTETIPLQFLLEKEN